MVAKLGARAYATTAAKRTVSLTVSVPKALRARVRRAAVRRLALTVSPTAPARAAFTRNLVLPR